MKYQLQLLFFFGLIMSSAVYGQDAYNIEIEIKNYYNDTLIIGNQYADRQIVTDTLFASDNGNFVFKGDEALKPGIYLMLMKPGNDYNQFVVSESDQEFKIIGNKANLIDVSFEGSEENELFYSYLDYLNTKRTEVANVREEIEKLQSEGKNADKLIKISDNIDREVLTYQAQIQKDHPNSITALLVSANTEIVIPKFEGTEEEQKRQRYFFYKKHFMDHVNMEHPASLRMPYQFEKIDVYMNNLTTPLPDSIIVSIDYLLGLMEDNPESYRYYVSYFLRTYAEMKIVGMDAVYVHVIDQYYAKGKTPWIDKENLEGLLTQANNLRGTLIGKKFPPIVTYMEDETPVAIQALEADFLVVFFWKQGCGHCEKALPHLLSFYDEFKDKGVRVLTICTLQGDKAGKCWEGVKEKKMEGFLNTGDKHQRYRSMVYVPATPKLFILDENKEIIMKDIPAENLAKVMTDILKYKALQEGKTD